MTQNQLIDEMIKKRCWVALARAYAEEGSAGLALAAANLMPPLPVHFPPFFPLWFFLYIFF